MTVLPRAATSPELTYLRSENQSARMYLTVYNPPTIYTARLDAIPALTDKVAAITYNSGSGTLANVLADMTLLVGSTAGAYDQGIARIRKDGTTTAGTFYIGEESQINWGGAAYLTVVDDFDLWPRHVNIDSDGVTPLMDYDVAYTNQHTAAGAIPTPVMGTDIVAWLRGSTVSVTPNGSNSWVYDGTITGYSWAAPGASATSGLTTATPTITYNAAGVYRIALTVTGSNAVTFTGYRYVFIVTESSGITTQFTLDNGPSGDYASGGWSAKVTLYDEATRALIRDRALVILHSVDYYGTTQINLGYIPGSENIRLIGRIAGESIVWGAEDKWGTVTFDIQGPQFWFGKMTAFPTGVKDVTSTPDKWTKFENLTTYKAWYHFMRWRTTATRMMDVYPGTDTRRVKRLESPGGQNIWAQLAEVNHRSELADPCCDRYGRIFLQVNQQFVSDRSSMPIIQAITSADWYDQINIERVITSPQSLIDMSGVVWDGTTPTPIFSLAPGHVFKHHGAVEVVDHLAISNVSPQADTNTLAGLYSAWRNNEFPKIDINFACNQHLIDIAPYQRLTLAIAATDTPRGIVESLTLIPRTVSDNFDPAAGWLFTSGTFEAEVTADIAVTGDTPSTPPQPPISPVIAPVSPPQIFPGLQSDAKEVWLFTNNLAGGNLIAWSGDFFGGGQPSWNTIVMPANYTPPIFSVEYGDTLQVAIDGSFGYLSGRDTANSSRKTIWQLSNISTIRTTPATAPNWTSILYVGQTITPGVIDDIAIIHTTSKRLYTVIRIGSTYYYSVYNGVAWSFTSLGSNTFTSAHANAILKNDVGVTTHWLQNQAGAHYGSVWVPYAGSVTTQDDWWGLYNATTDYWVAYPKNVLGSVTIYLRHVNSSTEFDTTKTTDRHTFHFGGAYGGKYCYVHDEAGNLWTAAGSNATFALFEVFATGSGGRVLDAKLTGGGKMVRSQIVTTLGNVPIFMNTTRIAGAWDPMTGNIATATGWVIGNLAIYSTQLVWLT